ncbi:YdbC family protein [Paenibacillus sp. Y412MC10]|uniref:YdbC family protein n=1 Tax=Geobacillus sp. (strain Y412MC10) TaxID=481743 RepID=UPI0011A486A7|nr:YdbC family protein [Paenibacillus sp. Y412MC10]
MNNLVISNTMGDTNVIRLSHTRWEKKEYAIFVEWELYEISARDEKFQKEYIEMLIKRITCQVKSNEVDIFSRLQINWELIHNLKGFIGQIGGWDIKNKLSACIYSFWESKEDYDYFMGNVHDEIVSKSNQSKTYSSINVELFEEVNNITGLLDDFISVLRKSKFIRTALTDVKEDRINHFKEVQNQVWSPGMKTTNAMLGGKFACSSKDNHRYLTLTGWVSQEAHENYTNHLFTNLKLRANTELDIIRISSQHFVSEDSWKVLGDHL